MHAMVASGTFPNTLSQLNNHRVKPWIAYIVMLDQRKLLLCCLIGISDLPYVGIDFSPK